MTMKPEITEDGRLLVKNEADVLSEIRDVVSRSKDIKATIKGKLYFHNLGLAGEDGRLHSPIGWVLRAQLGTVEKLEIFFAEGQALGSLELLAIARNLLENLVWLRLFNSSLSYGLVFYAQLLRGQATNELSWIKKIEDEIALFEEFEKADSASLEIAYKSVIEGDEREEAVRAAQDLHRKLLEELDLKARREFALYGAAAQFNSYAYQSHILQTKELPRHQEVLKKLQERQARLEQHLRSVLAEPQLALATGRTKWNWRSLAKQVGMAKQYEFLYGYTSRLLHSSPVNLVTDKTLSRSERIAMLEYAFVTSLDLFDAISAFSYPGQINAIAFEMSPDN